MTEQNSKPCIVIAGPTAVGKTALSIGLAKRLNGAVISADSMQVYRGMDIGTAKIRPEEMQGIPHYLIDALDPKEDFHVVRFQQMAKAAMKEIYAAGKIPIVVGGTGFYIQALLRDVDFTETGHMEHLRAEYERIAKEEGSEALHRLLTEKDPASAQAIHPNNVKRVIRALEFFEETGGMISEHNRQEAQKPSVYRSALFVITDDRAVLYERINRRVDQMIEEGLEAEVRRLVKAGCREEDVSMKGIGYREWFSYLKGEKTLEETIEQIRLDTRHFAKRQLTWFKREKDAIWLNRPDYDGDETRMLNAMEEIWKNI